MRSRESEMKVQTLWLIDWLCEVKIDREDRKRG
jgi:hypothetical protein